MMIIFRVYYITSGFRFQSENLYTDMTNIISMVIHRSPTELFSNLFLNPRVFFEEDASQKITVPLLLTLGYAVLSALAAVVAASPLNQPENYIGAVGAGFSVFISWILVSLLFLISLKVIGHAASKYTDILRASGYVSGIMMMHALLLIIINLIGIPNQFVLLLLSGVFLLWSIPIWYYGFRATASCPDKKLMTSVIVPVVIMAIISIISTIVGGIL